MLPIGELMNLIQRGDYDGVFSRLYPQSPIERCRRRYCDALDVFSGMFGQDRNVTLVSAPGRTEIGGNHTDHQRGMVLAAAVDLDTICVVSPNCDGIIRVRSRGYPQNEVDLNDLSAFQEETGTSSALIRGVAAWFSQNGYPIGGFDAYTESGVPVGSGLSSSAAFEVAVGNMLQSTYGGNATAPMIAAAGKFAENEYFGKPCGLMDQMASSVGGFVQIDFEDPENPRIEPIAFDLSEKGYHLCITDTRGSHAGLTGEYAAIPLEMNQVAEFFGKSCLRQVDSKLFYEKLPDVRAACKDRAVLRAIHFFNDNALVPKMTDALKSGNIKAFLDMSIQSGRSSFTCLQNVFAVSNVKEQGLSLALALSEGFLSGKGAWRVHGGGFAGTIQAFVPDALLEKYRLKMDAVFGENSCHVLSIRPVGGVEVTPKLGKEI